MKYSIWITLFKFALGALGGTIYAPLVQWLLDGIQHNNWTMNPDAQAVTITLISAAAAGLYAAGKNWWNNYALPKMDRVKLIKMIAIGGACGLLIGTQGCMTAGAGAPGSIKKPSEFHTEFSSKQPPSIDPISGALIPGEEYSYKSDKKFGAGVDTKGQDTVDFGIDADNSWHMRAGQNSDFSSQGQLQGLVEYLKINAQLQQQQQAQAWGSIMPFLSLVAPDAAALIGKKMDLGAVDAARDDENKANRDTQILQFLEGLSKRLSKIEAGQPKPATTPADSPGVDLPEGP